MDRNFPETPRQRRRQLGRQNTLTSSDPLVRVAGPSVVELERAMKVINRAAYASEVSEKYAASIAKDSLCSARRLDLLRAASVLAFKNAGADTVWDAAEYLLVPLFIGLCQGRHEVASVIATGMGGSDGREWLRELDQAEGDPLSRIIEAIARHCPQVLFGHLESDK